jgi:hypothetical protein
MAHRSQLDDVFQAATSEIRSIQEFAAQTHDSLAHAKPKPGDLTAEEIAQLRQVGEALFQAASKTSKKSQKPFSIKISKRVSEIVVGVAKPIKQRGFLAEMVLSYLVSHLESFIKDYLLEVLLSNPNMLKTNATLTYSEALSHTSIKQLRRSLAKKEVDALGYGSIDDISTYFQKRLNIDLGRYGAWDALREAIYRRNIVVHNQGRVNDVYKRKVGRASGSTSIHTDLAYVDSVATTILEFITFVHKEIEAKFKSV